MASAKNTPYYVGGDLNRESFESGLPVISEGLDSVRTYQFEIHFELPPGLTDPAGKLTLAAKQVTAAGFTTEAIEVHRVNDKVFYPGKASPEELTVTFDNFYQPKIANTLWQWFSAIYDPKMGVFQKNGSTAWKSRLLILCGSGSLRFMILRWVFFKRMEVLHGNLKELLLFLWIPRDNL